MFHPTSIAETLDLFRHKPDAKVVVTKEILYEIEDRLSKLEAEVDYLRGNCRD